jgi:Sporulation and spore germination
MKLQKYYIFPFIIATLVSGCASNSVPQNNTATPSPTLEGNNTVTTPTSTPTLQASATPTPDISINTSASPFPTPSVARLRAKVDSDKKAIAYNPNVVGKTTDVTLYTIDSQCQNLVPQTTAVSSDEPIAGAVGKILEKRDNGDFNLSSYRVNVKNGIATVDLRIAPNSKRTLSSLSSCEQTALFGSLRKTLTSNPQWKIKDVRFTEKGEEIVL